MNVGLNTQNLMGIIVVIVLSLVNIFGVKTGAMIQNVFTISKAAASIWICRRGVVCWPQCVRTAGKFSGKFLVQRRIGKPARYRRRSVGWDYDCAGGGPGGLVIFCRRLEQRYLHRGEVKNPSRNLPLSLALGTGIVITLYLACNLIYLNTSAAGRQSARRDNSGAGNPVRL